MPIRAVIYARYSSENQREASIEDQVRLCREQLSSKAGSWRRYSTTRRQRGQHIPAARISCSVEGALRGGFEVVVAEALDRLSRDQEDVAALFKQMQFAGIKIITLAEGEISELHVGLKGTMNALFLKDLAQKTHRGLRGRIEAGKSAGGRCYGYDVIRRTDEHGELVRGERAINPREAAVVQRIFGMFAAGASPIAIAKALNEMEIPGPSGRAWRDTTIRGYALRGTGILRNELYIGRLVWNRLTFIRNPTTGRRVSSMNPRGQQSAKDVPELRIIDQKHWAQVQARLANIRVQSGAENPDRPRYWETRRPHHVLTGKLFCGCCNGVITNIGRDYLACSAARRQGICDNGRGIRREVLEKLILDALRTRLMQPEHVAMFVAEFTAEWNRLQAESSALDASRRRELDAVERRLAGLIDAIADGLRAPGLQQRLNELEARKAELVRSLNAAPMPAPRLHPKLAEVYRQKVENLGAALRGADAAEAMEVIRSLIERVVLHPAPDGQRGFEIELIGEIAAMVSLGRDDGTRARSRESAADQALFESSIKVVAGARNHLDLLLIS